MMSFDTKKYGTSQLDVTYCVAGGQALKLDLYYPGSGGPWPGLVFIHGGGWSEGDKAPMPALPTAAGFLTASINYRMYPTYRFPAMIEDVRCAVRYLRAHAAEYNIDPQRIALIGHSAGGHLAALAGLVEEESQWDAGPYADQPNRVQAVVPMSGPYDLRSKYPAEVDALIANVFGATWKNSASPVSYIRKDAPPFLIVHGDSDAIVPVGQAYLLHEALRRAGAQTELVVIHNAGHGFEPVQGAVSPTMEELFGLIQSFLNRHLGQ